MSEMEPEARNFLVKIASSLSMGLLWMLVNMTIGIYLNYAFFDHSPSLGNYLFYIWFVASFLLLIFYYKRKWNF